MISTNQKAGSKSLIGAVICLATAQAKAMQMDGGIQLAQVNAMAGADAEFLGDVGNFFENVGNGIGGAAVDTGNWFANAGVDTGNWFVNAGEDTGNWFANAGTDTVNWFGNAGRDTGNWFANAGRDTGRWFVGAGNDISQWSQGAVFDTADWTSGAAKDIGEWTINTGEDVGEAARDVFNRMGRHSGQVFNEIRHMATRIQGHTVGQLGNFSHQVVNGIDRLDTYFQELGQFAEECFAEAAQATGQAAYELRALGEAVAAQTIKVGAFIKHSVKQMEDWTNEAIETLEEAMRTAGAKLAQLGNTIGDTAAAQKTRVLILGFIEEVS